MTNRPIEFTDDPYKEYKKWRNSEPVRRSTGDKQWNVAKHQDITKIMEDEERFTVNRIDYLLEQVSTDELREMVKPLCDIFSKMVILTDGKEDHERRRNLAQTAIDSVLPWFRGFVEAAAKDVLNEAISEAIRDRNDLLGNTEVGDLDAAEPYEMDLINDFARRLIGRVIPDLLGIEEEQKFPLLKRFQPIGEGFPGNLRVREEKLRQAVESAKWLNEYFGAKYDYYKGNNTLCQKEARHLMNAFANVELNGRGFDKDEFISMCLFTLMASLEAIGGLICNGLLALLRQPDKMDEFRQSMDDVDFLRMTVEELIRYDSPIQSTPRIAKQDIPDVGGKKIGKGMPVSLILASGNRDEEMFPGTGEVLDFNRNALEARNSLAFGYGGRECLGRELVQIQVEVAIKTLLKSITDIKRAPFPVEWREDLPDYRVLKHLHTTFKPI